MTDFDLSDASRIASLRSPGLLRRFAFLCSGQSTRDLPPSKPLKLPDGLAREWTRAVAEEWLLAVQGNRASPENIPAFVRDIQPLEDGRTLDELARIPGAMALVPLDSSSNPDACPETAHVWRFRGEPQPVRIQSKAGSVDGDSWQLGAELARRAADSSDRSIALRLARDWMITGAIGNGRVEPVKLGNKLDLELAGAKGLGRIWMLPSLVRGNVPAGFRAPVRFVSAVDSAWELLSGEGIVSGGTLSWPEQPVYHSLVSAAVEPVIAIALACKPSRVVLWMTDNESLSRAPAHNIKVVLEKRRRIEVELRNIDSEDITLIEGTLRDGLREDLRHAVPVIFNSTQGTRWMAYALQNVARLHDNLWLLYRDLDAPHWTFGAMVHDGIPPSAYNLRLDNPPADVKSDELFSRPKRREQESAEALEARLFIPA